MIDSLTEPHRGDRENVCVRTYKRENVKEWSDSDSSIHINHV